MRPTLQNGFRTSTKTNDVESVPHDRIFLLASPFNLLPRGTHLSLRTTAPVSTFHSTTSFPLEAEKRLLPSEENATEDTFGRPSP